MRKFLKFSLCVERTEICALGQNEIKSLNDRLRVIKWFLLQGNTFLRWDKWLILAAKQAFQHSGLKAERWSIGKRPLLELNTEECINWGIF